MPVHVIAFGSGVLVGAWIASVLWQREVDRLIAEADRLARYTAELRCEVLGHIFRPVTPDESDAVMAEWLSRYDPNLETK